MAADHGPDPFHHVKDYTYWESISGHLAGTDLHIHLPRISVPFFDFSTQSLDWYPFQITKFMLLELIAAAAICAIYIPLAQRIRSGQSPTGFFWNTFESILTFFRDTVAKPTLYQESHDHHDEGHGDHHGKHQDENPMAQVDKYVPYLWTLFLFILFMNLLGMIPYMGSPTGNIWVTGALGLCSFFLFHGAATMKMGFGPYMKAMWPGLDIPMGMGYIINPMIFLIEMFGTVIKSGVLAVRLFANMMAGHVVLGVLLMFIVIAKPTTFSLSEVGIWGGVTLVSLAGVIALSVLELFVAFLQAYIFTFLTALFLGMAVNPQH